MMTKFEAMEKIFQYCLDHENFTVLEIACALDLDLFFTLYVVDELINHGFIV